MRFAALLGVVALVAACSPATQRPYRLPYADGVEVGITADHTDHQKPPEKMFDLRATEPDQVVVAAAPGRVRFFEDGGDSSSPTNNYLWIEHPLDYCQPAGGGAPGGLAGNCRSCPQGLGRCNEWTLYAHLRQDSVQDAPPNGAGLAIDEWVVEGQPIGVEGDVGCQQFNPPCTRHLHFTVFVFEIDSVLSTPSENGDYEDYAETNQLRPERVPLFCTAAGLRLVQTGQEHVAGPCPAP
jgi:murein DD-endopeptidase MepM/ murein hydrolase activator NlpD